MVEAMKGVLVSKLEAAELLVPNQEREIFFKHRALSGLEIEDAQAAVARELLERYGEKVLQALGSLTGNTNKDDPDVKQAKELRDADPLTGYSATVLLKYGLCGWRGGDVDTMPCDDIHKDDLDRDTRRWAALQVLKVSRLEDPESLNSAIGIVENGTEPRPVKSVSPASGSASSPPRSGESPA